MKLTASRLPQAQCGNVLIMTLVFFGLVALTTAGYLSLAKSRALIRARSVAWNSAIPILEAGIEEGFTHLQDDSNALTANGWAAGTVGGQPVVTKSRTFPDGSYFSVALYTALKNSPLIYSSGFVPAPLGPGYISRTVRVVVTNQATFANAIQAKSTLTLSGSSVVDSFDSSNTNGSTGGLYDPAKRTANANVVTDSQAKPAVTLGNSAHIYGQLDTGPGGTVITSGTATVGDLVWSASHTGIESGYTNDNTNIAFSDVALPSVFSSSTSFPGPVSGKVNGTNYTYVLAGSSYSLTTLTLSGAQAMLVNGNAVLSVSGDIHLRRSSYIYLAPGASLQLYGGAGISISGSSYIYIAPGASLQLYGGGASTTISGVGVINATGNAANFSYYGLTNNTTLSYSGSSAFIGTVYAPEASFTLSGAGGMYGAAVVYSYTPSDSSSFHYDQALSGSAGHTAHFSYTEL
jgi:hypothetical protein